MRGPVHPKGGRQAVVSGKTRTNIVRGLRASFLCGAKELAEREKGLEERCEGERATFFYPSLSAKPLPTIVEARPPEGVGGEHGS